MAKNKKIFFIIFSLGIVLLSFMLGIWQLKRNVFKKDLIARYERNIAAELVDFNAGYAENYLENDFRIFNLEASFIATEHFGLGPKFKAKVPGYHLYVFAQDNLAQKYLINTGFISTDDYAIDNLNLPQSKQKMKVMLRVIRKANKYLPDNDLASNFWFSLNKEDLKEQFDYDSPGFYFALIEPDFNIVTDGFPKHHLEFYDEHIQYAITWFLLSFILVVLTVIFIRKK